MKYFFPPKSKRKVQKKKDMAQNVQLNMKVFIGTILENLGLRPIGKYVPAADSRGKRPNPGHMHSSSDLLPPPQK